MNPKQYARRQALLGQIESVLENWPERSGTEYQRRMETIIRDLDMLAREVDETSTDRLERARTWRYLGNARFEHGKGSDPTELEFAAQAYKRAEILLSGIENPQEKMKLAYSYGHTLFGQSRRSDIWLVEEAKQRFRIALDIAAAEMPEAVGPIESALEGTGLVIDLLKIRKELYRQISAIKRREAGIEAMPSEADPLIPEEAQIFEQLIANYHETANTSLVRDPMGQTIDRRIRCF